MRSPLPRGAATDAKLDAVITAIEGISGGPGGSFDGILKDGAGNAGEANVTNGRLHVDPSGVTSPVSIAATVNVDVTDDATRDCGKVDVASLDQYTPVSGRLPVDGSGVTQPVSIAATVTTKETRSATGTTTQVADNASSTTLLSSNSNRLGCSVQNTSSAVLYLKCGTTATTTDFTARLIQYAYWEAPYNYTGRIDGIWASDPGDGAAVITEYT